MRTAAEEAAEEAAVRARLKAKADANATTDGGASPDTGAPARPTAAP